MKNISLFLCMVLVAVACYNVLFNPMVDVAANCVILIIGSLSFLIIAGKWDK